MINPNRLPRSKNGKIKPRFLPKSRPPVPSPTHRQLPAYTPWITHTTVFTPAARLSRSHTTLPLTVVRVPVAWISTVVDASTRHKCAQRAFGLSTRVIRTASIAEPYNCLRDPRIGGLISCDGVCGARGWLQLRIHGEIRRHRI